MHITSSIQFDFCLPDVTEVLLSVQYNYVCETSKLYILFVDKEHMVLGISVKTTWKFFVKQKFQLYS